MIVTENMKEKKYVLIVLYNHYGSSQLHYKLINFTF